MSLQYKNFLKLTLFDLEAKDSSSKEIPPFKLKISFNNQTHESEKITTSKFAFPGGKCFYFELSSIDPNESIIISAVGTSWMVFNSTLATVSIPFQENIQKFNDQKTTYNLLSSSLNISLTCSIWCEFTSNNTTTDMNTSILNKTYTNAKIQNDISAYDNINAMLNNTTNMQCHLMNDTVDHNNTMMENSNVFSPFSDRINSSTLNNISMANGFGLNCNDLMGLIDQYAEKSNVDSEVIEKLKSQINSLKEKEESIKAQQLANTKNIEKIKEKEIALNKEKTNLEEKIKKFKASQSEFDKKNKNLSENTLRFENELTQYVLSREVYDNTNSLFYSLNHYIATGVDISSNDTQSDTVPTSINGLSPTRSPTTSLEKSKSKEIIMETVSKYLPNSNNTKSHPPTAQINLNNFDYQTPKNEKFIENKLIDSLECNFIPHKTNNKTCNKKTKVIKRNNNDNTVNISKTKKVSSIGQTMQVFNRANKNNIGFTKSNYKRDFSSQNNNTGIKSDVALSSHKAMIMSHKKKI